MSQSTDASPPDWAIKQASTALQSGMSAPDVEHRLVAVGLAPRAAKDVMLRARSQPSDPPPMLDWALEHVRASLRAGVSVPDIERRLVARGLTPEVAEVVTTRVLGERVRGAQPDTPERGRQRMLHRILSFVVACACVFLAYRFCGGYVGSRAVIGVLFPVFFIWFGDFIGPVWARIGGSGPLPGVVVRWLGWSILVPILLFLIYVALTAHKP